MKCNLSSVLASLALLDAFAAAAPAPTKRSDLEVGNPDGLDARGLKKRQPAETDAGVAAVAAGLASKAQMTTTTQPSYQARTLHARQPADTEAVAAAAALVGLADVASVPVVTSVVYTTVMAPTPPAKPAPDVTVYTTLNVEPNTTAGSG